MNNLLSPYLTFRQQGIIFHTLGWGIFALCAWLVWGTVSRYLGTTALINTHNTYLTGEINDGVLQAQDALAWLGQQPGIVELAINWNDPQAAASITELSTGFSAKQKSALEPFMAIFQRVHNNDPSLLLTGSNAALLVCADKCKRGIYTPLPTLSRDEPPHKMVLLYTLQQQFLLAWNNKDREHIWRASSAIRLLAPRHPQQQLIACISDALAPRRKENATPASTQTETKNLFLEASVKRIVPDSNSARTVSVARQLMELAPENTVALLPLIPSELRTPNESALLLGSQNGSLENIVKIAASSGTPIPTILAVIRRCIDEKQLALAKSLVPRIPEHERRQWLIQIALAEHDLTALKQLTAEKKYSPRAYAVSVNKQHITCHLYSDAGIIPNAPVEVRVDDQLIPAERIERAASFVHVTLAGEQGAITLMCDGETLFTGKLP
jgi:hypothetical protein